MWLISGRFTPLLASLLGVIVASPFMVGVDLPVLRLLFTLMFFAALYSVSRSRWLFAGGLVLVLPAIVISWLSYLLPLRALDLLHLGLQATFMIYVATLVLGRVLEEERVSADTIYGGISVYLLIALAWSSFYAAAEYLFPGSLVVGGVALSEVHGGGVSLRDVPETVYFSFVTITTLGYGDIVPATPLARSLAIFEAVTGQLFIAIFMARLVGLHLARRD